MAKKTSTHTISMLVNNKPGVLVRIALAFARRGFNIDSLVVSPAFNPRFSRMTITAQGDPETLKPIIHSTNNLVDVIHAFEHTGIDSVHTELALYKVKYTATNKPIILKLMKKHHGHVVNDLSPILIIRQSGATEDLDAFETVIKKYPIVEMVRTGKVVMTKGREET